jgi:hypothetical protein
LTIKKNVLIFELLNGGIFIQGFLVTTPADFVTPLKTKKQNEKK